MNSLFLYSFEIVSWDLYFFPFLLNRTDNENSDIFVEAFHSIRIFLLSSLLSMLFGFLLYIIFLFSH